MAFPTDPIYKLIKSVYTNEITGVKKQTGNLNLFCTVSKW